MKPSNPGAPAPGLRALLEAASRDMADSERYSAAQVELEALARPLAHLVLDMGKALDDTWLKPRGNVKDDEGRWRKITDAEMRQRAAALIDRLADLEATLPPAPRRAEEEVRRDG